MPRPLPDATRTLVDLFLTLGMTPQWIAHEVGIGVVSVHNIRRDIRLYGISARPPRPPLGGRPYAASSTVMRSLEDYILRNPWVYQDEIAGFLWQEWGLDVHQSTVSRMLRRMRFSRKVARRVSYHQLMLLRAEWVAITHNFLPQQCVFVDESAFNERTG